MTSMKKILIVLICFSPLHEMYAQKIAEKGIIEMKIETKRPEDETPTGNQEGGNIMRWGDLEMKGKMYFKDSMSKMMIDMGFSNSQIYYNAGTKTTTTLFQAMGKKMGFYSTDEEVRKAIETNDSTGMFRMPQQNDDVMIEYLNDEKKIAGYPCKKANIRYINKQGEEMQQTVWYSPDFMVGTRFRMSSMMRMASVPGMQKLKGFPMEYELKRNNGMTVFYMVTKVDLNVDIKDNEFVIPSGYDIKPMSDMMKEGGRGFMIRQEDN
jgi:GLPGLI family protein